MLATVTGVKFNEQLGRYTVTKLAVTTDKGEDKSYNIFTNQPYHNVVAQLVPGDNIELKMEKNGKYWNVVDVIKVQAPAGVGQKQGGMGKSYTQSGSSQDKDIAIARAVTLKAAVELYSALVSAGLTKKTLKPDAAAEEVLALCKKFEGYCTLADDLEGLTSDTSSIKGQDTDADFEEVPFD